MADKKKRNRAEQSAARQRMKENPGMKYTQALREVRAEHAAKKEKS